VGTPWEQPGRQVPIRSRKRMWPRTRLETGRIRLDDRSRLVCQDESINGEVFSRFVAEGSCDSHGDAASSANWALVELGNQPLKFPIGPLVAHHSNIEPHALNQGEGSSDRRINPRRLVAEGAATDPCEVDHVR